MHLYFVLVVRELDQNSDFIANNDEFTGRTTWTPCLCVRVYYVAVGVSVRCPLGWSSMEHLLEHWLEHWLERWLERWLEHWLER